jgi:hypothetical protein
MDQGRLGWLWLPYPVLVAGDRAAIVPAHLLRSALGNDRVLSDADVELLATTAWTSLRPAA